LPGLKAWRRRAAGNSISGLIALAFDKTNTKLLKNNSKYFKEIPAGIDQG
jgi:hypothetical protein